MKTTPLRVSSSSTSTLPGSEPRWAEHARRAFDDQAGRPAVGGLERLEVLEFEALEVDPAPFLVGTVGQADLLVDVPCLTPPCAQPVGLPVEAGDLLHGLQGKGHC